MDFRKNRLLMIVAFGLSCILPLPMIAMLSKPQYTPEDQRYTWRELALGNKLIEACIDGQLATVKSLIESDRADVNYYDHTEITPLYAAITQPVVSPNNNISIVQYLVEKDADVNAINNQLHNFKMTALNAACQLGKLNIVIFLVDHGANIEAKTIEGETPLFSTCCTNEDEKVVQYLIGKGADVNTKNIYNQTALIAAVEHKHYNIAKELLKKGADVNAKNKWGEIALHYACFYGNVEMVDALLKAGADAYAEETEKGFRPIDIACLKENSNKLIALFNKYGVVTESQEQANQAMHKFFAELNQEKSEKIQKREAQKERKQEKTVETKKKAVVSRKPIKELGKQESTVHEIRSQELFNLEPTEQVSVVSPVTTSTTSTTSTTTTIPTLVTSMPTIITPPSKSKVITSSPVQNKPVIQEEVVPGYQVIEGTTLKWPRSLSVKQEKLIENHFQQLKNWPNHGLSDVKKLENQLGKYRLRVGGYRIIFLVNTKRREIVIQTIGLRKNIYKKF